jgi:hypothetical protein
VGPQGQEGLEAGDTAADDDDTMRRAHSSTVRRAAGPDSRASNARHCGELRNRRRFTPDGSAPEAP